MLSFLVPSIWLFVAGPVMAIVVIALRWPFRWWRAVGAAAIGELVGLTTYMHWHGYAVACLGGGDCLDGSHAMMPAWARFAGQAFVVGLVLSTVPIGLWWGWDRIRRWRIAGGGPRRG